jgi:hypothetical protein
VFIVSGGWEVRNKGIRPAGPTISLRINVLVAEKGLRSFRNAPDLPHERRDNRSKERPERLHPILQLCYVTQAAQLHHLGQTIRLMAKRNGFKLDSGSLSLPSIRFPCEVILPRLLTEIPEF